MLFVVAAYITVAEHELSYVVLTFQLSVNGSTDSLL